MRVEISAMRVAWGSPLGARSGWSWVSGSCGAAIGRQTPHTDLAGDGAGNQDGAGNRYRAVSSSTLHLAQGTPKQGRCRAAGAAEEVIARDSDRSCF
jgi:hypothetical protein